MLGAVSKRRLYRDPQLSVGAGHTILPLLLFHKTAMGQGSEGNKMLIEPKLPSASFHHKFFCVLTLDPHPTLIMIRTDFPPAFIPANITTAAIGLVVPIVAEALCLWIPPAQNSTGTILQPVP